MSNDYDDYNDNNNFFIDNEEEENDIIQKDYYNELETGNVVNENPNNNLDKENERKNENENEENNNEYIKKGSEGEDKQENLFKTKVQEKNDISDIKYNTEPFLTPEMKKKQKKKPSYNSKMDKAIDSYNKIKSQINNAILRKLPENFAETSHQIGIMLNNMDKLNTILSTVIETGRMYNKKLNVNVKNNNNNVKKNAVSNEQNDKNDYEDPNEKLLLMYKKEYEKMKERLELVTSDNYVEKKKKEIEEINKEIEILKKDNKSLRRLQKINDSPFRNEFSGEKNTKSLKEKMNEFEKYTNIYNSILKKIESTEQSGKNNEIKLTNLEEKQNKLLDMAKEMYNLTTFDNVSNLQKKENDKKYSIIKLKQQIEVNEKALESSKNKFQKDFKHNDSYFSNLNKSKEELLNILTNKKKELEKYEENIKNLEKDIEQLNNKKIEEEKSNNNNFKYYNEINRLTEEKKSFEKDFPRYRDQEKEMILKELDKKQEKEKQLNNSITLKKNINLKPNFSFTPGLMSEENRLNKSSDIKQIYNLDTEIKEDIVKEEDKIEENNNVKGNERTKVLNTALINNEDFINKDLENLENENYTSEKNDEETIEKENVFNNISDKVDDLVNIENENNNDNNNNNNK